MVASVETREFQGTITSQVRVDATSRAEAERKLRALESVMPGRVKVDEWSVPLIRDMVEEGDNVPKSRYQVDFTLFVESPSTDTARCVAGEMSRDVMEASNLDAKIENQQETVAYYERRIADYTNHLQSEQALAGEVPEYRVNQIRGAVAQSEQMVKTATDQLDKLLTERANRFEQGSVVDYRVRSVQRAH